MWASSRGLNQRQNNNRDSQPWLQKKLVNTPELTLKKAILICEHEELNFTRLKDMSLEDKSSAVVHAVSDHKTKKHGQVYRGQGRVGFRGHRRGGNMGNTQQEFLPQAKCTKCGYLHDSRPCLIKGQMCRRCHDRDHFQKCCKV